MAKLRQILIVSKGKMYGHVVISYLIYDRLKCDLQIVHPSQLHGLINALRSQRVSTENGVWIPTKGGTDCF